MKHILDKKKEISEQLLKSYNSEESTTGSQAFIVINHNNEGIAVLEAIQNALEKSESSETLTIFTNNEIDETKHRTPSQIDSIVLKGFSVEQCVIISQETQGKLEKGYIPTLIDLIKSDDAEIEEKYKKKIAALKERRDPEGIEKGGEGSRGGKVVGHTKSGKAIYEESTHESHKNFTHQEHKEAYELHVKRHTEEDTKNPESDEAYNIQRNAQHHLDASKGINPRRRNRPNWEEVPHIHTHGGEDYNDAAYSSGKAVDESEDPEIYRGKGLKKDVVDSKVLGKTRSGKTIHTDFNHPDHKDFTYQDHYDATKIHQKNMYKETKRISKLLGKEDIDITDEENKKHRQGNDSEAYKYHEEQREKKLKESGDSGSSKNIRSESRGMIGGGFKKSEELTPGEIQKARISGNIQDTYNTNLEETFEKGGKRAEIGEVRMWGKDKWVKHQDGWVNVNIKSGKHTLERPGGKREPADVHHVDHALKILNENRGLITSEKKHGDMIKMSHKELSDEQFKQSYGVDKETSKNLIKEKNPELHNYVFGEDEKAVVEMPDTVEYDGKKHEVMRVDGDKIYIRPKEESAILGKKDEFWVKKEDLGIGVVGDHSGGEKDEKESNKYKRESFTQPELEVGQDYTFQYSNGVGRIIIDSIEDGYVNYRQAQYDVSYSKYRGVGEKRSARVAQIQSNIKQFQEKTHNEKEDHKEAVHDLSVKVGVDKIKGGDLKSSDSIDELTNTLQRLVSNTSNTKSESVGGQYYGGTAMYSSRSGQAISIQTNDVHRGGRYEGNIPFLIQIQVGGALESNKRRVIKEVAKNILSKYSYESEYGKSRVSETDGTNWESVMLTAPQKGDSYNIQRSLDSLRSIRSK